MKIKVILGLLLSLALLPAMLAHAADNKIGYVNVKQAIQNTDAYKQGQSSLKTWQTKKRKEIASIAKKMQKLDHEIKTQGMALSAASRDQKIRKLKALDKVAKRKVQDAQEEGASKQERMWVDGYANFQKKIKAFGKKSGYSLILSDATILYATPSDDLTSKITSLLNKK